MKNFIFKSTEADLQKMFSYLDVTSKNVLYLTHQIDYIRKTVKELLDNKHLQSQVDEYFEETPPQTERVTLTHPEDEQ